jgi:predicted MFS family arabinose efflux permease
VRDIIASKPLAAAVLIYAASATSVNIVPHQVTAYVGTQHLTDAQVGIVAMCETAALAIMTIVAVVLPSRHERVTAVIAPLLAAVAQLASIVAPDLLTLCLLRTIAGAGCGAAGCVAARTLGTSAAPGQNFGISNGLAALISGLFLSGVPYFPSMSPGIRVFVPLGVLAALLGAAGWFTPERQSGRLTDVARPVGVMGSLASGRAIALLVATMFLFIPLGGVWTFSVQQGTSLGLSERQVGVMLAWMIPAGVAGGGFAAWIHRRTGLVAPLCLACTLASLTCIFVAAARTPLHFGLAFVSYAATYMFAISVLQAAGAKVDTSGRLSAVMFGMTLVGCALGSYIVGLLLDAGRSSVIGTGGTLFSAVAGLLALWAARRAAPRGPVAATLRGSA